MEKKTVFGRDGIAVCVDPEGRVILINLDSRQQAEVQRDCDFGFRLEMLPEPWEPEKR